MVSRYQRTIAVRYRKKRWHKGLSHLWYNYHRKMFGGLIIKGLKLKAYKRFSKLLAIIKKKERLEPRHLFLIACMRVTPRVAIKKFYRGTRIIFHPLPLSRAKQPSTVIQWFLKPLRDAHLRRTFPLKKLVDLLMQSLRRRGEVHKRKLSVYKLAKDNRKPKIRFKHANMHRYKPFEERRLRELRHLSYKKRLGLTR